jgi:dihydropteroate synthase
MMPDRRLAAASMTIGPRTFVWGARTYIMGVINVSPDSFSGDGLANVDAAVEQARRFAAEGADILDVGGQSTRPGATKSEAGYDELPESEEIRRVVPVIERIRTEIRGVPISVDTYKPGVARAAIAAGAGLINSIEGFRHDGGLAALAAESRVPAVIMHNQRGAKTSDVVADIVFGLEQSIAAAGAAGLQREQLIIDPGFGFGWTVAENIEMLRRLDELHALGMPLLIGTSRKSTIGTVLGGAPVEERLFGTAATVALAIASGADIVRVHDVAAMKQVALVADAIARGWPPPKGRAVTRAFLGLGANVGNREQNLRMALRLLATRCRIVAVSSLYRSAAVVAEGDAPGPDYLNAACEVDTELSPDDLLALSKEIEHTIGRRPAPRWAPRPIDIDLLLYGDQIIEAPELSVPHPRMNERNFVLVPLAELAPRLVHPSIGQTVGELAAEIDLTGVEHIDGPEWSER